MARRKFAEDVGGCTGCALFICSKTVGENEKVVLCLGTLKVEVLTDSKEGVTDRFLIEVHRAQMISPHKLGRPPLKGELSIKPWLNCKIYNGINGEIARDAWGGFGLHHLRSFLNALRVGQLHLPH